MSPRPLSARRPGTAALAVLAVLLVASAGLAAGPAVPAAGNTPATAKVPAAPGTPVSPSHRVLAYYFHNTQRCDSCQRIEAYARAALEVAFPKELQDGRLVWLPVNLDEKGNEHYAEDYNLFTKSLVLVEERDGKTVRWKNLPRIWELLTDETKFAAHVQEETRAYLAVPRS
jgi:hypothetical protein